MEAEVVVSVYLRYALFSLSTSGPSREPFIDARFPRRLSRAVSGARGGSQGREGLRLFFSSFFIRTAPPPCTQRQNPAFLGFFLFFIIFLLQYDSNNEKKTPCLGGRWEG